MVIFEFNKAFYHKIYILIGIIVVLILGYLVYTYNKQVFDITKVQFQLNTGAEEILKQKISWHFNDSQLIGEISFTKKKLQLTYYLNKKRIGYKMVEKDTNHSLQLPCLNIVQVLPVNTIKQLYQKLLVNMSNYTISKIVKIKRNMYVEYLYKKQDNQIITSCFVYYK